MNDSQDKQILAGNVYIKTSKNSEWKLCYANLDNHQIQLFMNQETQIPFRKIEITKSTPIKFDASYFTIPYRDFSYTFKTQVEDEIYNWISFIKANITETTSLSLNDFDVISVIGRGYFGKVRLVKKKDTKEYFALKSLHKKRLIDSGKIQEVFNERNTLAKCSHPFIVKLAFAFQTDCKFYFGLEYLSGGDLFFHLDRSGPFTPLQVRFYITEIALALQYLHQNGIIYRDLKPENVMLHKSGHIALTDFGLAKEYRPGQKFDEVVGTTEYLAPEVVSTPSSYSIEIDWWALGVLAAELIQGSTPFYSRSRSRVLDNILKSSPNLSGIKDLSAVSLILHLLEKDPLKRMGFQELKNHPFFEGINWDKVLGQEYFPPIVPISRSEDSTSNFDQQYTQEVTTESYGSGITTDFDGFAYNDET